MKEMIDVGKKMALDFANSKNQFEYLKALAVLSVPKKNLLSCYRNFCRDKKVQPIEELDTAGKQKTWETSKEIACGRLKTIEEIKDLCRCLITLEYFLT